MIHSYVLYSLKPVKPFQMKIAKHKVYYEMLELSNNMRRSLHASYIMYLKPDAEYLLKMMVSKGVNEEHVVPASCSEGLFSRVGRTPQPVGWGVRTHAVLHESRGCLGYLGG